MRSLFAVLLLLSAPLSPAQNAEDHQAQTAESASPVSASDRTREIREIRAELTRLSARLDALENTAPAAPTSITAETTTERPLAAEIATSAPESPTRSTQPPSSAVTTPSHPEPPQKMDAPLLSALPATLPGGATLNYTFDGYYEYNFNQPAGRVNQLRAYDVLSNTFSINQATVIFSLDPDLEKGRRYGMRVDLQYGQATDTLQGNPANEPRPGIYQNIFQAYGTYIVPVGKGLTLDFGKWASSIGIEGNYTKDQLNYTRSFYFYFLPFYHQGVRATYRLDDKFAVNYWLVNGTNQSEPTNGYRDELFGFQLTPTKSINWTSNYYLGQEHPDSVPSGNCTGPVQPGLCVTALRPAPNGKLHIFDNYITWQATPKFALAGEGDYVIERPWAHAGPGQSATPSHVSGGALYAQYQATSRASIAARTEYLSDRGGLFSGTTEALKEFTGSYKYGLAPGLDTFVEFRRDWSNTPYFNTHSGSSLAGHQTTATLGLVWYYGGKQGNW